MESQNLVSIIIPVYNTAPYLKRCIESVRNQTLKEIEIILVNNLSTDDSPFICDEYAKIDSRIRVLHLDQAGLSIARNAGINIASAPYIGFIDSDDYIESAMYEDMLTAMIENEVELVYCNFCFEYEDGRVEQMYSDTHKVYTRSCQAVQRDIILEKVSSSSCTKLFSRKLFDSNRFPVGMFFEDHATIYRWIGVCNKIAWVDFSYYHYMQRSDSICHTFSPIKHYHYFLAEYSRLDFVKEQLLFSGEELYDILNLIVRNCFNHFNAFMQHPDCHLYSEFSKDMRRLLRKWLVLSKVELNSKYYKRLRKIAYFWPIYNLTHYR